MKNIPVLTVSGRTLPEAYERALTTLMDGGIEIKTQYDRPGDPLSKDATMNITIGEPLSEPRIHKAFPGGIEDLREYYWELIGKKDHWVKAINDHEDERWLYTYHGRLAEYGRWKELDMHGRSAFAGDAPIDQFAQVVAKLAAQPYTRQAQMITWMPKLDIESYDPPCLQSMWFRILFDEANVGWLNTNIRFRSNDAWGAFFMNAFGFIEMIQELILKPLSTKHAMKVEMGRINWHADSWHIYGKDIARCRGMLLDRLAETKFEDRVYNLNDPDINDMYFGADEAIFAKIGRQDEKRGGKNGA